MRKILKDWFTGLDGESHDLGRVLWALTVMVFLVCTIIAVIKGQAWDAVSYGTGAGLVLAGGGLGLMLKKDTEPK